MFKLIRIFLPYGYDIIPIFVLYSLIQEHHYNVDSLILLVLCLYIGTRIAILIGKAIASFMSGMFFTANGYLDAFILKLFYCFGPQTIAVIITTMLIYSYFETNIQ